MFKCIESRKKYRLLSKELLLSEHCEKYVSLTL